MEYRKLGKSGLRVSQIGLGGNTFGWYVDEKNSISIINRAIEMGVNYIDTAPAYGLGHSEELVAEALKRTSHKPIISTKCGILWNDKKEKITCLKKESIRNECHNSLKRLNIEMIDLYQIHWPDPDEDVVEAWEEMIKLRDEGKIRYLGVCNFNIEQLDNLGYQKRAGRFYQIDRYTLKGGAEVFEPRFTFHGFRYVKIEGYPAELDLDKVKGLEFDYVVVVDVDEASFPSDAIGRRRLHVAATRAVHQLWLTSVKRPAEIARSAAAASRS